MDIPKLIYTLTSPILRMKSWLLFVLICVPLLVHFKITPFPIINFVSMHLGEFIIYCWVYAIGYAANQKLVHRGMALKEFRYFNWMFVIIAVSYLILHFTTTRTSTQFNFYYSLNISEPFIISIPLALVCIATYIFAIHIAAKSLMTTELNRKTKIGEVGSTSVLI